MALATLEELTARLEWALDSEQTRLALGSLEELSDQALYYGKSTWTEYAVPRLVKNTILSAVARYMRNPDGYTQSRAGDETLAWTDRGHEAGSAYFNDREIKMIRAMAGHSTLVSVPLTAWGPTKPKPEGYVPVAGSAEKPFPMFESDDGPW